MKVVVDEVGYPEGPLVREDGVWFVEYARDRVVRWDGEALETVWHEPGSGPASVCADANGRVWVAAYEANQLVELRPDGAVGERHHHDQNGEVLLGPNDFAPAPDGRLFFTASGVWDPDAPVEGRVLAREQDGTIRPLAEDVHYANGLTLSPDGQHLLVAEHFRNRLLTFPLEADGQLGPRDVFANLEALVPETPSSPWLGPDGLTVDSDGRVWVAHHAGGQLIGLTEQGEVHEVIPVELPFVTNVTEAEEGGLYVTAFARNDAPYPGAVLWVQPSD